MKIRIVISKDGTAAAILPEDFDTSKIGKRAVHRLSQVSWFDYEQGWKVWDETTAKWLPKTFKTRTKAIEYERWYMDRKFKKVLKFAGVK